MRKTIISIGFLCLTANAHAWQFEAGAGATHYETENGRWYQNGQQQNSVTNNSPAFSAGVTGSWMDRGNWGIDGHADFVYLGRAAASCHCLTRDEDYAAHRDGPRAGFSGSGNAYGASLTVEPYRYAYGLRWSMEAGAFVYHSSWSESVTGWAVNDAPKQDLHLSSSSWNVAPVVGVSVGTVPWSINYRHYFTGLNSKRQNVPPVWNDADVLEIKRRF
jgi:hypothetical protein